MVPTGAGAVAGIPRILINALPEQGASNLTIVSNNCVIHGAGLGLLLDKRHISRVIACIGENKESTRQYLAGELHMSSPRR